MAFEDDGSTMFSPTQRSPDFDNRTQYDTRFEHISTATETRTALAAAYARYIVHVLHVLLHGEWDAITERARGFAAALAAHREGSA